MLHQAIKAAAIEWVDRTSLSTPHSKSHKGKIRKGRRFKCPARHHSIQKTLSRTDGELHVATHESSGWIYEASQALEAASNGLDTRNGLTTHGMRHEGSCGFDRIYMNCQLSLDLVMATHEDLRVYGKELQEPKDSPQAVRSSGDSSCSL
jgi:hypothetical protein